MRARPQDAGGVGMPAPARIALGSYQHVLAERWQTMTAEWAAIRRGLAIRRAPHRPPRGGRKTRRHRPILAPASSISSRAASLAGTLVVLGMGVALAKAERERRAATRARMARRTSLLVGEPPAVGLRRVLLGQLEVAIELLETLPPRTAQSTASGLCTRLARRSSACVRSCAYCAPRSARSASSVRTPLCAAARDVSREHATRRS